MRGVGFVAFVSVLLAGTSAYAQVAQPSIGAVTGQAGSVVTLTQPEVIEGPPPSPFANGQAFPAGAGSTSNNSSASAFNSFVNIGNQIVFESSNQGTGPYVGSASFSQVKIEVNNPTGQSINFASEITAAGMGFYLANTNQTCLAAGNCVEALGSDYNFQGLAPTAYLDLPAADTSGLFAYAQFQFAVTRQEDGATLFSRTGLAGLRVNDATGQIEFLDRLGSFPEGDFEGFGARSLTGFQTDVDRDTAIGFSWDATDISFDIGALTHQTLVYSTLVTSFSAANCVADGSGPCLLAYAGFGDPIGAGGGILSLTSASLDFEGLNAPMLAESGPISGVHFTSTTFDAPVFADGSVRFVSTAVTPGIPEPATWATMMLGFGLLGATMRRRRLSRLTAP